MNTAPNILLITSDQQHYSTLGSVNPHIRTPALDRLAAEGTRFDRAYCNNPGADKGTLLILTVCDIRRYHIPVCGAIVCMVFALGKRVAGRTVPEWCHWGNVNRKIENVVRHWGDRR